MQSALSVNEIDRFVEDQMSAARVPGLALAIVRDRQLLHARGFGVTSVEGNGLPVTSQTLFAIGSITKSFVAIAILRLVEAGALDLDWPVKTYIPWFTLSDPDVAERITLRMLLSHTAGLPTSYDPFGRRSPKDLEAYVRHVVPRYPIVVPPGRLGWYSNVGFCVAGYIAAHVGGMDFPTLMHTLVFDPLAMALTTFDPCVAMTYPIAQAHVQDERGAPTVVHQYPNNPAHLPAGYAISTVLDLANVAIMLMQDGRFRDTQLLTPASVTALLSPQVSLYSTRDRAFGLGFFLDTYKGIRTVGHDGHLSSYYCVFSLVPLAGVAIIVALNAVRPQVATAIAEYMLDRLLGLPAVAPLQFVDPDRTLWAHYAGTYLGARTGLVILRITNNELVLDWHGELTTLRALGPRRYTGDRPNGRGTVGVGLAPGEEQPAQFIVVNRDPCRRVEIVPQRVPAPGSLGVYVGTYEEDGVGTLTVRTESEQLFIGAGRVAADPLVPLGGHRFAFRGGVVEFHVSSDGRVSEIILSEEIVLSRVSP